MHTGACACAPSDWAIERARVYVCVLCLCVGQWVLITSSPLVVCIEASICCRFFHTSSMLVICCLWQWPLFSGSITDELSTAREPTGEKNLGCRSFFLIRSQTPTPFPIGFNGNWSDLGHTEHKNERHLNLLWTRLYCEFARLVNTCWWSTFSQVYTRSAKKIWINWLR